MTGCGKREVPVTAENTAEVVGMTNDEIIAESQKCKNAGLTPEAFQASATNHALVKIQCHP